MTRSVVKQPGMGRKKVFCKASGIGSVRFVEITVLAFAQAQDSFGFSSRAVSCTPEDTARAIIHRIAPNASLEHLRVAIDEEYVTWDTPVGSARELALIPPVSGG